MSYGGTDKYVYLIMKYASQIDDTFNHVLIYNGNSKDLKRLPNFISLFGEEKCIAFYSQEQYVDIVKNIRPFILHRHAGGIPEFPFVNEVKEHCKNFIDTGTFGNIDDTINIDRVLYLSEYLKMVSKRDSLPKYRSIYWPVEDPISSHNLRSEFGIPKEAFVFGRIGRPDNSIYHNINVKAFNEIQKENVYFLVLAPSENLINEVNELGVKNVRYVDKTVDEYRISSFYNTIDVLSHARLDGETYGMNIVEAMSHGKPTISHYSEGYNAHLEIIRDCGFTVMHNDYLEYAKIMKRFVDKDIDISYLNKRCKENFKRFSAISQTKKTLDVYKELL